MGIKMISKVTTVVREVVKWIVRWVEVETETFQTQEFFMSQS